MPLSSTPSRKAAATCSESAGSFEKTTNTEPYGPKRIGIRVTSGGVS